MNKDFSDLRKSSKCLYLQQIEKCSENIKRKLEKTARFEALQRLPHAEMPSRRVYAL
jgi:hypothetical protein